MFETISNVDGRQWGNTSQSYTKGKWPARTGHSLFFDTKPKRQRVHFEFLSDLGMHSLARFEVAYFAFDFTPVLE